MLRIFNYILIIFLSFSNIALDESVNVIDIVSLINQILDLVQLPYSQQLLMDINNDGIINVVDIVQLVSIVLGENVSYLLLNPFIEDKNVMNREDLANFIDSIIAE